MMILLMALSFQVGFLYGGKPLATVVSIENK